MNFSQLDPKSSNYPKSSQFSLVHAHKMIDANRSRERANQRNKKKKKMKRNERSNFSPRRSNYSGDTHKYVRGHLRVQRVVRSSEREEHFHRPCSSSWQPRTLPSIMFLSLSLSLSLSRRWKTPVPPRLLKFSNAFHRAMLESNRHGGTTRRIVATFSQF